MDHSYVLLVAVILWTVIDAQTIQTNVDTEEPSVIRSPAADNSGDGFGWTAIFHQTEVVQSTDSMSEALRKTRYVIS